MSNKTVSVISHFHSLVKNNSVLQPAVCRSFQSLFDSLDLHQSLRQLLLQMCIERLRMVLSYNNLISYLIQERNVSKNSRQANTSALPTIPDTCETDVHRFERLRMCQNAPLRTHCCMSMCSPLLLLCYSDGLHITVSVEPASVLSFQTLRAIRSVTMAHGYWCQE